MTHAETYAACREAVAEVIAERHGQNSKWGPQNHSPLEWMAILVEEVGEAQEEALEHHWEGKHYPEDPERLQRYRAELVQVAAVAVAAIESVTTSSDSAEPSTRATAPPDSTPWLT